MDNQTPIQALFTKYLENRCTPDEIRELLFYFQQDQNEDSLFLLIRPELDRENSDAEGEFDADIAIAQIRSNLLNRIKEDADKKIVKLVPYSKWLKVSAVWLLLGTCALLIFRSKNRISTTFHPVKLITCITKPGLRKYLVLPDGSKIWLSPSSSLEYPDQFNGNLREVKLEGEAFFEVAKDKKHPFIIHTGPMDTRVVGTSFDIQSYKCWKKFSVTVVTGIVKVSEYAISNRRHREVTLQPNQRSILDNKNDSLTSSNYPAAEKMLERKEGILVYDGSSIQEVIADLSSYYNVPIKIDNKSKKSLSYGEFDTNKPIEIVLRQLAAAINAKLIVQNNQYLIKGGFDE